MIKKLQLRARGDGFLDPPTASDMYWKINELVDAVNALVYEHDKDSDWYDGETPAVNVQEETNGHPFENDLGEKYEHCEPVKPDDDIIYKGGKDE